MKIVVLTGSPRRGGNSDQMAEAFIRGALVAGHTVERFDTAELNVMGCVACGGCYPNDGCPCCHNDDFNQVGLAIEQADLIAFVAPLYWSTFPAPLKRVIDNFYCYYCGGHSVAGKRAVLLSCGEDTGYMMFDGIQRTYELILPVLEWTNAGTVFVPGVNEIGDIQKTDGLKRCEELAKNL